MVHIIRLLSAAALVTVSSAAPMMRRDSAIGDEVAVSAPNGIVLSDTPTATSGSYQTPSSYDSSSSSDCNGGSCDSTSSSSSGCDSGNCDSTSTTSTSCDSGNCDSTSTTSSSCDSGNCDSTSTTSSGCDSGSCDSTSTSSMYEYSSTMMYDTTSTMMYESSSTSMAYESSSTSSAYMSYSTPSYGSGSSNWGGSGYNDCVQQCAASFGMATATWTPPTATQDSSMYGGSSGSNGVTHTIIVAPTQGVLRYVPFSTNASVGDTITFHWNAGPHTVTQSSGLEVCNRTDISDSFASGMQNEGFNFNMVINDTKPIWFYCGVKTHCEQGMFGGINIGQPNPDMGSDSSSSMGSNSSSSMGSDSSSNYLPLSDCVQNMTSSNSDMMAVYQYTKSKTSDNTYANNWGMSINVAGMDDNAKMQVMRNVLWTQTLIAANPDAVDKDKGFQVTDKPLTFPADISNAIAQAPSPAASGTPAAGASSSSSQATSAAAASGTAGADKSGAVSITSSSVAFAFVAIVASFLML